MQRLYDIKTTQVKMVRDRGFDISSDAWILDTNLENFTEFYLNKVKAEELSGIREALAATYKGKKDNILFVSYPTKGTAKQIGTDTAKQIVHFANTHNVTHLILIADAVLSTPAANDLNLFGKDHHIFNDEELTYCVVEHKMVSRHELIPKDVAEQKMRDMKTKLSQLPLILTSDPVIKYYGWKVGGLVKIYRNDQVVGLLTQETIAYRIIVEG